MIEYVRKGKNNFHLEQLALFNHDVWRKYYLTKILYSRRCNRPFEFLNGYQIALDNNRKA